MSQEEKIEEVILPGVVTRIGVVSDTHIPTRARFLPRKLFTLLRDTHLILHAGDLVEERVLEYLRDLAPVEAVAGNMDPPALRRKLGRLKIIRAGALAIGLVHGDGDRLTARQRALAVFSTLGPKVIVFGHSHQPLCEDDAGILLFNPGSAVDPRRRPRPSCGLLIVSEKGVQGEFFDL